MIYSAYSIEFVSMSIIDDMRTDEPWDAFLEIKRRNARDYTDILPIQSFIVGRKYRPIVEAIAEGKYVFKDPMMFVIPKASGGSRKVFSMKQGNDLSEAIVVQVMSSLLKRYEEQTCPNLCSVKKNGGVETAMIGLSRIRDLDRKYFFKFDITNYGNSIPLDQLFETIDRYIDECDEPVKAVMKQILSNPNVVVIIDGKKTVQKEESKGAMTGLPFTGLLTGLYLNDLDWYYYNMKKTYYRFNDDVSIICDSLEDAEAQKAYVVDYITRKGLTANGDKMKIVCPGENTSYLGIKIEGHDFSINDRTVERYKERLKKKSKQLRIQVNSGEISNETAFDKMILYHSNIMYGLSEDSRCFTKTYFGRINTSKNLSKIDHYAQFYIRYAYTGKYTDHNNGLVPYQMLRDHGYVPLVSAYRIFRSE